MTEPQPNRRWSDPPAAWVVRAGRLVSGTAPPSVVVEARIIRRLNELRTEDGDARLPNTEWAYRDPPAPPARPDV
ncbi:MAG: hypothetical protein OXC19_22070 [Bryobacterales bacterium]|nr:hypothetical protein [Bryobacterales bacterium]